MKIILLHLFLLLMYDSKREVFIFYNQAGVATKNGQLAEFDKDKPGMQERDISLHIINTATTKDKIKEYRIDTSKVFTVILVGKDGGEKLRLDSILTITKLFATIDAMPMRKSEVRNR